MSHKSDNWMIEHVHNTARFFTENRHIAWMVLVATVVWGIYGYANMPQRKDPDIPVKVAMAIGRWPGVDAVRVEELLTRRIEETVAENVRVKEITSTTRLGVTFVTVTLKDETPDPAKEFDDIKLRLDGIKDLPQNAQPVEFIRDFESTAALMLTVASPRASDAEIAIRARAVADTIRKVRAVALKSDLRAAVVFNGPASEAQRAFRPVLERYITTASADGTLRDARVLWGAGFLGVDGITTLSDSALMAYTAAFVESTLHAAEFHPDAWPGVVIRDPAGAEAILGRFPGEKYSYAQLDDFTDLIRRSLQGIPVVTKVSRKGLLDEQVLLSFSQERLAAYGLGTTRLKDIVSARNIPEAAGAMDVQGKTVAVAASGEFKNAGEIGGVVVGSSRAGTPLYLRDLVEMERGYKTPASYLNYFSTLDAEGHWHRSRAVTLSVEMRSGAKIGEFGRLVDSALVRVKERLPEDLVMARTSDQPRQVEESVELLMDSLVEAIALVILVALVGFWEWRSALLMAISIPLTLAMTFGMMSVLGIDLQQVSIASLIIALGLLVDDPVVAGDAIKRDLAAGHSSLISAWLGPTKLATAIMYATVTNIVAYLPFLLLPGNTGLFLYSLPVVMTCALVASRLVSMTFIPLVGYYLLRPGKRPETPIAERRQKGFAGWYYRVGHYAIEHRKAVFAGSLLIIAGGVLIGKQLKTQFFPKDLSYFSTVDVWLPEDASVSATQSTVQRVEQLIHSTLDGDSAGGSARSHEEGHDGRILRSLTTFVGGGGPRFWSSLSPEPQQGNYAQIIIEVLDKHETRGAVDRLQPVLAAAVPGARITVKELETGEAVGIPVSIRIVGDDIATLRAEAAKMAGILRNAPNTRQVQDNWGAEGFAVHLDIDPDRTALAGLTNADVASAAATALNGYQVGTLRDGDRQIPIVARLRMEERSQLADLGNLYVYSTVSGHKVPLRQVSTLSTTMQPAKLTRRNQFRAVTVSAYPTAGHLPSEVMKAIKPALARFAAQLPPGFRMEIAGEQEKQQENFGHLAVVMLISIAMIYIALVLQFRNTVKPLLVFAAIPYGIMGALLALYIMGTPFGFMAFLGVASLIGVIVSHVIVLFDFIEEAHAHGESLVESLLDAGIMRLRPVLITVGATVLALFPLSLHGGPLWEPLCYAQIGGLITATFVTLLLVPVLYSIFVLDLKIVAWDNSGERSE